MSIALPGRAAAQDFGGVSTGRPQSPGFGDCALEGAGAFGIGLVSAAPPLYLTFYTVWGMSVGGSAAPFAIAGCATATIYALGSATGATLVGYARGWSGSFGRSFGLAMIPPVAMVGTFFIGYLLDSPPLAYAGMAVFALGTPAMAVVGYNLGTPARRAPRWCGSRIGMPGLSLERVETEDGSACAAMNIKLVTVRF